MKSRFVTIRNRDNAEPTQAEIRRARDFWGDVFADAINAQIDDTSAGRAKAQEIVEFAGDIADHAVAVAEKRWGKV